MTVQEQPVGNVALETKAGEAVMQAILQMQPINLSGVAQGMLWLTPSDVQRVPELHKGPHWEYILTPLDKAEQVAAHNHGIYRGGEKLPPVCADCGSPATRVGLLEAGLPVQSLSSKLRVSTKADAQKVFQALRDKRIWYAVPFCAQHSLESKSISLSDGHNVDKTWKVTAKIADADFGRTFGELNDLKGVWVYPTFLGDVKMHDPRDKDELPRNWLLRIVLMRLPLFLASAAACAYFIWALIRQVRVGGGELCSVAMIPAAIALIVAFALLMVGYQVGHFPKAGKP